jgi:hypothetical protein
MGGSGGAGTGGSGGGVTEPPISGPAPTACVPTGPSLSALGASRTVLYSGSEQLEGLAVRRSDLFATDATGIVRLAENATSLERVTTANVVEVLAADLRLYWMDAGSLYRVDFDADDAAPDLVVAGLQSSATLLRHDETNVFYMSGSSVWRQPLDGTTGEQVVSAAATDLAVAGMSLFYASGQAIKRVSTEGGTAEDVMTGAPRAITDIETNGVDLVWTDGVEVFGIEIADGALDKPLTQAGPSAIGMGQSRIRHLALLGNAVYFADDAGSIGKALLNGSLCELIVAQAGDVRGLIVDDDSIYVNVRVASGSELWRIAL